MFVVSEAMAKVVNIGAEPEYHAPETTGGLMDYLHAFAECEGGDPTVTFGTAPDGGLFVQLGGVEFKVELVEVGR